MKQYLAGDWNVAAEFRPGDRLTRDGVEYQCVSVVHDEAQWEPVKPEPELSFLSEGVPGLFDEPVGSFFDEEG